MTQTLLVKEFIEFGRALGEAESINRDAFNDFLSKSGYASLNAYHGDDSISDEVKQANYVKWLDELETGSFEKADKVDVVVEEVVEKVVEEEVVEKVVEKVEEVEVPTRKLGEQVADQISDALTEALSNLKVGGVDGDVLSKYDKAITAITDRLSANEQKTDKAWVAIRSHETDDNLHQGEGRYSTFNIHVTPADRDFSDEQPLHYKFPLVAAAVTNRIPTMIVGPAGWGKTSSIKALSEVCSEAWDDHATADYRIQSIGPQTSKSDILGYMDANGEYVESVFYQCFKHGMIYACDEADAGSAGSLTLLNQGFANTECNFPGQDTMTARHDNFVPMFLANTYGQGANATYVGRNQLDAATLDRFAVVEYDYDETWEGRIVGVERDGNELKLDAGGKRTPEEWIDFVSRIRKGIDTLAVRHVVSPRATIHGLKLLKAGLGFTHVSNMCVWKGLDSATRTKVLNEANG